MWSSAADIARALSALMHEGRVDGKQAIPAAVVAQVMAPQTPMPNVLAGGHYGYGLMMSRDRGVLIYEHGGTLPGFSSILRFAPQRGVGIAILANLDNAPLRRIAGSVIASALALPPLPNAAARNETPMTPQQLKPFLGPFRNRGTAMLQPSGGSVVLSLDDGPAMTVSRLDGNRYIARPASHAPGLEIVLHPATASAPAYLHFALWAYAKE
jgi:CubicO group peptidase (beta-lactamase class C family)